MLGFNVLMVYEKLWGAVPSEIRHSICREYRIYVGLHKILYGCLLISLKWLILRLLLSFFFLFSFLLHLLMDLTIFSHIILPFSLHFSHLHLLMFWHDSFRHLMNVSLGWFSIPWWRDSFADLTIRKLNSILKSGEVLCTVLKNILRLVSQNFTCKVVKKFWEVTRNRVFLNVFARHT